MQDDFRLGGWLVQPRLNRLCGDAGRLTVPPKAMDVLVYLASRPREVVGKEALLAAVWERRFVGGQVLTNAVWELRRALGDDARAPRYIETVAKRGYRLRLAPAPRAAAVAEPAAAPAPDPGPAAAPAPRSGSLSVGVAPWRDLSGDADRQRFGEAMTELLTAMLARVEKLEVVLLGGPAAGGGEEHPATAAGEQGTHRLDAVLQGSVLRWKKQVRLTARLVARGGTHLWAGAYERELTDLLRLQAEVAQRIVDEIEAKLGLG